MGKNLHNLMDYYRYQNKRLIVCKCNCCIKKLLYVLKEHFVPNVKETWDIFTDFDLDIKIQKRFDVSRTNENKVCPIQLDVEVYFFACVRAELLAEDQLL